MECGMTFTCSEHSRSSDDVMVSPKHPKMAFHCEDGRQCRGTNANKQYILTNKYVATH